MQYLKIIRNSHQGYSTRILQNTSARLLLNHFLLSSNDHNQIGGVIMCSLFEFTFWWHFHWLSLDEMVKRGVCLTHYSPVLLFDTPWKHQKTFRFSKNVRGLSDVFRGCRKTTPGCYGLTVENVFYEILKLILQMFW